MWTRNGEETQEVQAAGLGGSVEYTTLESRHIPTWLSAEEVQTNITVLTKQSFNMFFLSINPYNGRNAGTAILNYKDRLGDTG